MTYKQRFRSRILLVAITSIAIGLVVSLYNHQILKGAEYSSRADKQYAKPKTSLFDRGSILFTRKNGTRTTAASVSSGYLLYVNPTLITSPKDVFDVLSPHVSMRRDDFIKRASKVDDIYEEIAHRVSEEDAQVIRNLGIKGVGLARETWRTYPGGSLAAHGLGLMGETADQNGKYSYAGRYGLERTYHEFLSRPSTIGDENVVESLFSGISQFLFTDIPSSHGNIVLTIDPEVQTYLEQVLKKIEKDWKSDEIGGIIMDPNTGDIVAMASLPTFNPNDTSSVSDVKVFSNPLVEHVYELGSIMKPLTVGVGIDTDEITKDWIYEDTGTMTLNGRQISNFDGKARGATSTQQILSQSLNIGAATIALEVGGDRFYSYLEKLGLGKKTGIDLPNESTGLITNLKSGKEIDIATASYGQGIAVSPISMVTALSSLANGGYIVQPHLVSQLEKLDGTVEKSEANDPVRVFEKETTTDVTNMLVGVVDTSLKKGAIKRERYSVAAKTGTAQIPDPASKKYFVDKYLHSFFGYFPAHKAKYIVFLYHINPKEAQYASETLTLPFDELVGYLINYFNIPPDR